MSIEIGNFRNRLVIGGAAIACAASLAGAYPRSTSAETQAPQGLTDCLSAYPALTKESACSSYRFEAIGSLWLFYKAGNSSAGAYPKHHFRTRFFPPARDAIERRVAGWPEGTNEVDQEVHFVDVVLQGSKRRAFVKTLESWSVRHDGNELLRPAETEPHPVWHTLCYAKQRILPGINKLKPYSEWLITDNGKNKQRNCSAFAGELVTGQIK